MRRIIKFLIFSGLIVIIGCAGVTAKKYYNDQKNVSSYHDPDKDISKDKNKKFAVLIPDKGDVFLRESGIDAIIDTSASLANINKFKIIPVPEFRKKISKSTYSLLPGVLQDSNAQKAADVLTSLARENKIDYIFIPTVSSVSYTDEITPVQIEKESYDGDYYWPSFQVMLMEISGVAKVELRLFSVEKKRFVDSVNSESTVVFRYDTPQTFMDNQRAIRDENIARKRENMRREREDAKAQKKNKDVLGAIMDALGGNDLDMISDLPFTKNVYEDKNKLYAELYRKAFNDAFLKLNEIRYDGETLQGNSVNGEGTFKFVNGTICKGNWVDGKANGKCELNYYQKNKLVASFIGEFLNGYANGYGEYSFTEGDEYKGYFSNGYKNGEGIFYYNQKFPMYIKKSGEWSRSLNHNLNGSEWDMPVEVSSGDIFKVKSKNGSYINYTRINSKKEEADFLNQLKEKSSK